MTESNTPLGCGTEGPVSQHADLLNTLEDMAGSGAYAVRKGVLRDAGRTIMSLERELAEAKERFGALARKEQAVGLDNINLRYEVERQKVCISEAPEMRWIPVSERAPDGQYDVLVTDGELVSLGDCCKGHLWNAPLIGPVTHWMPLPGAPK